MNFSKAKFRAANYVVHSNNSNINFNNSPELIVQLTNNRSNIITLFAQYSKLFEKLLGSNFYQSDQGFLFEDVIISDLILTIE